MVYYALNLFDLKDPEGYREYIRRARPVNESSLGSEVLAFGRLTDQEPHSCRNTHIERSFIGPCSSLKLSTAKDKPYEPWQHS